MPIFSILFLQVNSDTVPVQTLLEALLNLCVVGNVRTNYLTLFP
jgi:hypothetical protein